MITHESVKPTIKVFSAKFQNKQVLDQMFYGMEEEGIPFEYAEQENADAVSLAYEACNTSVLGVGIGLTADEIVLHYEKLAKDNPLFRIPAGSTPEEIRTIGTNSARLVKKVPFKIE